MEATPEIIGQVIHLLQNPEEASRNRLWEEFNQPSEGKALKIYKLVRSLEEELAASRGSGQLKTGLVVNGLVELKFHNPVLRYTRICYLPQELFAWLAQRLGLPGPLQAGSA